MDSNSWEIVDKAAVNNHESLGLAAEILDSEDSDKEFTRQSSRYGQNVKNYE